MNKLLYCLFLAAVLIVSCKQKKEEKKKKLISVISLVKEQIAHVDTSIYVIRKIVITDSTSDTTFIPREQFGNEAKDFVSIPDLGIKKYAKLYQPDSLVYDESINRVIISYHLIDETSNPVKKQVLLIIPGTLEGDKIVTAIITQLSNDRNGYLKKEMLWQFDKSFQVTTTSQKPGAFEKIVTLKVSWNEDEYK